MLADEFPLNFELNPHFPLAPNAISNAHVSVPVFCTEPKSIAVCPFAELYLTAMSATTFQ